MGRNKRLLETETFKPEEMNQPNYEKKLQKMKEASERKEARLKKRLQLEKGKPKRVTINQLKKELRRITHRIVRFKYPNCYSCGKFFEFAKRQAGHFHTDAGNPGTRYDLDNLRTQCQMCNYHVGGDASYATRLLKDIGIERFNALDERRKIKPKWSREELIALIEERKGILANLENQ